MKLLVMSGADVHAELDPVECRTLMRAALTALARQEVFQPLRTVVRPPGLGGLIALMPTHLAGAEPAFGMKSVCVFPGNPRVGKDAHQGVVTLFDPATGEPLAAMNASAITEIRTAAVSAVATQALARPGARVLTVFGSGTQARAHVAALRQTLSLGEIRVVSRDPENARRLAGELEPVGGQPVTAFADPQEACLGADVIVTATTSPTPVLRAGWVGPGTHVNAVGSSIPTAAEIDPALLAKSVLVADRRESLVNESGDYLQAVEAGAIGPGDVYGELGDVLTGARPGRSHDDQITVFKSLGLAVEDVVVARHLYERARQGGRGQWVEF